MIKAIKQLLRKLKPNHKKVIMKDYLLFFGDCCYPCGGMDDYVVSSNSIKELISVCDNLIKKSPLDDYWAHIYSTKSGEVIKEYGTNEYGDDNAWRDRE